MKSRYALLPVTLLLTLLAATSTRAQDNGPFWVYARIEVNVTIHTPAGDKHQFRVYVSNLISVTDDEWTNLLEYKGKENVTNYFNATVGKAGESRGEEYEFYDSDVEYDCTCTGTANEVRPKSDVERTRNDVIETAKSNEHPVVFFNWDPTGRNKDQDLQAEMQKLSAAPSSSPGPTGGPKSTSTPSTTPRRRRP